MEHEEFIQMSRDKLALILQGILAHQAGGPETKAPFQLAVGIDLCERIREVCSGDRKAKAKMLDGFLNMFFVLGMSKFFSDTVNDYFKEPNTLEAVLKQISNRLREKDPEAHETIQ